MSFRIRTSRKKDYEMGDGWCYIYLLEAPIYSKCIR
ncbi:hypothetical protein LSH36_31g00060 [Paralvinella palmiformis]|uniref:Uncharacterized protein n=1 Tax=Paralvinella palmiformis TaxID=53620 RepID=A0AAD9K9F0_9ANNE|nr:hypothetical protein LSH36_31g00060 [Paralvinella palmiformis]